MKFVSVRDLRGRSADVWRQLADEREMVITSNGKPVAILSSTSEDSVEESLLAIRRARGMAAVEAMQSRSLRTGADKITLDEINAEIAAVRAERKR